MIVTSIASGGNIPAGNNPETFALQNDVFYLWCRCPEECNLRPNFDPYFKRGNIKWILNNGVEYREPWQFLTHSNGKNFFTERFSHSSSSGKSLTVVNIFTQILGKETKMIDSSCNNWQTNQTILRRTLVQNWEQTKNLWIRPNTDWAAGF